MGVGLTGHGGSDEGPVGGDRRGGRSRTEVVASPASLGRVGSSIIVDTLFLVASPTTGVPTLQRLTSVLGPPLLR